MAVAVGYNNRARANKGSWIVLAERDDNGEIISIKSIRIDGKKYKENTWYVLKDKKIIEYAN